MAKHRKPTAPRTAVRRVLLGAVAGSLALTGTVAGIASAHTPDGENVECTTDYQCAAWELYQANQSGVRVHEDLSFAGASPAYGEANDLLADRFYAAHPGAQWPAAQEDLEDWLDGEIA
jgi:hypothetical protein